MAGFRRCSVSLCDLTSCLAVILFIFAFLAVSSNNVARASSSPSDHPTSTGFTCEQVRELFEGDLGAPALHSQPEYESDQSLCLRRHGGRDDDVSSSSPRHEYGEGRRRHVTCCSEHTESQMSEVTERRLKERVRTSNVGLKKHLATHLSRFTERISELLAEAGNRTSDLLSSVHKMPENSYSATLSSFLRALGVLTTADTSGQSKDVPLEDAVRQFFTDLFPQVFRHVLTSASDSGDDTTSQEYDECLKRYAEQIQPFANQPDVMLKKLRHSVRHTQVFLDAVRTFTQALSSTETVVMHSSCRHALLRLQVCPGCRGLQSGSSVVKPCRGLCLNTMRGCLAQLSEISSAWDDLVVAFENVQVGMRGRHDLPRALQYLDLNVSEAVMMALRDSRRIYDEVGVKCRHVAPEVHASLHPVTAHDRHQDPQPLPLMGDTQPRHRRPSKNLHGWRQDVSTVVGYLEDSRGLFNRLPDSLCQDQNLFSQDMQSDQCWNGSSVGRYMEQVPEVSLLSQVQHNAEVKVALLDPDHRLLEVKDTLQHMRRNLSSILNWEVMQGDSPIRKNVASPGASVGDSGADREVGSGAGGYYNKPVIVDDEDLVAYSGSGSGSGDGGDDEGGDSGSEHGGTVSKTDRPVRPPPGQRTTTTSPSSVGRVTTSTAAVLSLCALSALAHLALQQ